MDVGDAEPSTPEVMDPNNVNTACTYQATEVSGEKGSSGKDPRSDDIVALLGDQMPSDPNSHLAPYLSGFMSLRLLLLRPTRSPEEEDRARTMLDSCLLYTSPSPRD